MIDTTALSADLLSAASAQSQALSTVVIGAFTAVTTVVLMLWLSRVGGDRDEPEDRDSD